MHLNISLKISKKAAIVVIVALILAGASAAFYIQKTYKNPLPDTIKKQISFKAVYPSDTSKIDQSTYDYKPNDKVLTFTVKEGANNIVFTQQPAPDSLGSDSQPYYPALGIHPQAQFKTKLGLVALTKFWQSGSFKFFGESGVMVAQGTFLVAHTDKDLTNAEWKKLFESLKITK